ncbi:MAG: Tfp pilus assembly protein FimT/FimU [Bdellovibrionales bacterium]
MMRMKERCKAFSLTEMALVLLVMGVIFAGAWVAASGVRQQGHVNETVAIVAEIARNVRNVYTGFPSAAVPTLAEQISREMFPTSIINDAEDDTVNAWAGNYRIVFLQVAAQSKGFFIDLTLPATLDIKDSRQICVDAALSLRGTGKNVVTRAGVLANLPVRNEAQGEAPTNVFLNDKDVTEMDAGGVLSTLGTDRCTKMSFYYPF